MANGTKELHTSPITIEDEINEFSEKPVMGKALFNELNKVKLPDTSDASVGNALVLDENKKPVWGEGGGNSGLKVITAESSYETEIDGHTFTLGTSPLYVFTEDYPNGVNVETAIGQPFITTEADPTDLTQNVIFGTIDYGSRKYQTSLSYETETNVNPLTEGDPGFYIGKAKIYTLVLYDDSTGVIINSSDIHYGLVPAQR